MQHWGSLGDLSSYVAYYAVYACQSLRFRIVCDR